jgi:hypothetical protein
MFQTLSGISGGCRVLVMLIAGASLSASQAQTSDDHARVLSSPATANVTAATTVTPLKFESTLSRYKPMTDQKLGSWREANDTVTRIGGWRAYLKEAQAPDDKSPTPTNAPAAPGTRAAPNPHDGHGAKP